MSNELTLEELAAGATKPSEEKKPKETNNEDVNVVDYTKDVSDEKEEVEKEEPVTKSNDSNLKEVSVNDIAKTMPKKEEDEEPKDYGYVSQAFDAMTETLEEKMRYMDEVVAPIMKENAKEIALENEIKQLEEESNAENKEPEQEQPASVEDINIDDDDTESDIDSDTGDLDELLEELDTDSEELAVDESDDEETVEETRERFKESLSDIKITSTNIDINNIKIRKNPISVSTVLNTVNHNNTKKCADWVLFNTGRAIRVSECSGPELDALRKTMNNSNDVNSVISSLKLVYNHLEDGNKPSFEEWAKSVRTEDIESLYFALYKACYSDINLIGRSCESKEGCGKTSIIKTDIDKMVKYEDDETKKKFDEIFAKDTTTYKTGIESTLIQISDDFAISYTEPTLYSTFIQFSALKQEITRKYSDLLNSMAYIDSFYKIDKDENGEAELIPIEVKVYPHNIQKTVITKLKVYSKILKTLNNDQYNILTSKLNNLISDPKVTYVYPEDTCPECGATLPEEDVDSMLNLLFTRAQLAQIKSL